MIMGLYVLAVSQRLKGNLEELEQRQRNARRRKRDAIALEDEVGKVRRETEEVRLHLACMIALLIRKGLLTKDEFGKLAGIIDRADGVADGRFSGAIREDGSLTAVRDTDDLRLRELAQAVQSFQGRK
jgi:hypothetical protein